MSGRPVLYGLCPLGGDWTSRVDDWCRTGRLHAEFRRLGTTAATRSRIRAGEPVVGLLVDVRTPGLDRGLLVHARQHGCRTVLVGTERPWPGTAGLPRSFDPRGLVEALRAAAPTGTATPGTSDGVVPTDDGLVAVCGAAGSGVSTVAIAVAQALARTDSDRVLLVDAAAGADHALYHHTDRHAPSLSGVAAALRHGPDLTGLVDRLPVVTDRGYRLLPGPAQGAGRVGTLRDGFDICLDRLAAVFATVVVDLGDIGVPGGRAPGLPPVHGILDRARMTVLVCGAGVKGLHGLVRRIRELQSRGVAVDRVIPLVVRAPAARRRRSEFTAACERLIPGLVHPPVYVPSSPAVDDSHRRVTALPDAVVRPVGRALQQRLDLPPTRSTNRDARRVIGARRRRGRLPSPA